MDNSQKGHGTSSRESKLARLTKLRKNIPLTSKSALEAILQNIKKEGLPELTTSKNMRQGCKAVLEQMNGYGPLLLEHNLHAWDGSICQVKLVNLLSYIHGAYKAGGGFHAWLKKTMARHNGPLSLLVYADEITPGNVLANVPARKIWCIYISIKEFGLHLQKEAGWMSAGLIRSDIVASLDGHLSQVLSALLDSIFYSSYGNVQELGLQLQEPAGHAPIGKRLLLQLGFFIMDGQAAKFSWSTKGDSGSRFCQQCANIFQLAGDNDNDAEDGFMSEIAKHSTFENLHLVSDQEIFQSWDRMKARHGNVSKKEFQLWEQACGISFSPFALLANPSLRPILKPTQQNCWDWMNCLLSNGVMNMALYNVLEKLDQWELLSSYVQHFQLPKSLSNIKLVPLFDSKRLAKNKKHKKIIATASELLTLCSIVAHYMRVVCLPANACKGEVHAFLSILCLIDLLQATWHGTVVPSQLLEAAESSLKQCVALDWKLIKKHHWMLHFHQMLSKHQCIPNTFCMERKNKMPGRIATLIQNLSNFEYSVYSEVLTLEMERLSDPEVFAMEPALLQAKSLPRRLVPLASEIWYSWNDVSSSNHARIKHGMCSHGDMVYLTSHCGNNFDCGQVQCFLSNTVGDDVAVLNMLHLKKMSETFAEWEDKGNLEVVPLQELLIAVTFAKSQQKITTLTPWSFR